MLEPVGPGDDDHRPLVKRLGWFFGIAIASMLVVVAVAYTLRAALFMG